VILSPEMTAKKCKAAQLGANVMGTAIDGATDGSGPHRVYLRRPHRARCHLESHPD
jgi:hypothetical protein